MGQTGDLCAPGKLFQHASHKQQTCDVDRGRKAVRAKIDKPAEDVGIAAQLIERVNSGMLLTKKDQKGAGDGTILTDGSRSEAILLLFLARRGSVKTAEGAFLAPSVLSFVKMRTWTKPQSLVAPRSCCDRASGSRSQLSSDAWLSLALGCGKFLVATPVRSGGYVRCSLGWGLQSSPYRLCRGRPI